MAKAIAQYANKGIAPSFSNSALKAIFTLFRSNIEAQRESSAKRSEINTTNAMGKKSAAKKKVAKKVTQIERARRNHEEGQCHDKLYQHRCRNYSQSFHF